jgi:hypothetical protein
MAGITMKVSRCNGKRRIEIRVGVQYKKLYTVLATMASTAMLATV